MQSSDYKAGILTSRPPSLDNAYITIQIIGTNTNIVCTEQIYVNKLQDGRILFKDKRFVKDKRFLLNSISEKIYA